MWYLSKPNVRNQNYKKTLFFRDECHIYNPETKDWDFLAVMEHQRASALGFQVEEDSFYITGNGQIYLILHLQNNTCNLKRW